MLAPPVVRFFFYQLPPVSLNPSESGLPHHLWPVQQSRRCRNVAWTGESLSPALSLFWYSPPPSGRSWRPGQPSAAESDDSPVPVSAAGGGNPSQEHGGSAADWLGPVMGSKGPLGGRCRCRGKGWEPTSALSISLVSASRGCAERWWLRWGLGIPGR